MGAHGIRARRFAVAPGHSRAALVYVLAPFAVSTEATFTPTVVRTSEVWAEGRRITRVFLALVHIFTPITISAETTLTLALERTDGVCAQGIRVAGVFLAFVDVLAWLTITMETGSTRALVWASSVLAQRVIMAWGSFTLVDVCGQKRTERYQQSGTTRAFMMFPAARKYSVTSIFAFH